jgi:hypothetical protein
MVIAIGGIHKHGIHINVTITPGHGAVIVGDYAVLAALNKGIRNCDKTRVIQVTSIEINGSIILTGND